MPPSLTCRHCPGLKFANETEQATHRKSLHQKAVNAKFGDGTKVVVQRAADTKMFHCTRCAACYAHPSSFRFHTENTCTGGYGSAEATAEGSGGSQASTSLVCVLCPHLTFSSKLALSDHHTYVHMHSSQATITFASDGATVTVQRNMETHLFPCPRCPTGSRLISGLRNHAKSCSAPPVSSNSETLPPVAPTSFKFCKLCPELVFANEGLRSWHRRNVHQTTVVATFGLDGLKETVHRDEATLKFACPRCSFTTKASGPLQIHAKNVCTAPPLQQQPSTSDKSPSTSHTASASSTAQATTSSPLIDPRRFPCLQCPELAAFKRWSQLGRHIDILHQRTVRVTFANGDLVVLHRDVESNAFHCFRCSKRSQTSDIMVRHALKCPGAYGQTDSSVDDVALQKLGLSYDATNLALICVPCKSAVTLNRIAVHWSTPEHEGEEMRTETEVRKALGHNAPLKPAYLDRPDPHALAHPLLELVMGWRCSACAWRGLVPDSYGHWNSKHAARLGEMPDEMTLQVKLQRWNSKYAYFEVEREADSASSSERQASRATSGLRGERSTGPKRRAKKVRATSEASLALSLNSGIETASSASRDSWVPGYDWEDSDESERDFDEDAWEEALEAGQSSADEEWIYSDESNPGGAASRDDAARSRWQAASDSSESEWEGPMVIIEKQPLSLKALGKRRLRDSRSPTSENRSIAQKLS